MTGQIIAAIVGLAMVTALLVGGLAFIARDHGWREALSIAGFAVAVTAITVVGTFLAVYGFTGSVK